LPVGNSTAAAYLQIFIRIYMLKRVQFQLLKLVKLQNAIHPRAAAAATSAAAAADEETDLESCSGSR
jgi:hypothetical protein